MKLLHSTSGGNPVIVNYTAVLHSSCIGENPASKQTRQYGLILSQR